MRRRSTINVPRKRSLRVNAGLVGAKWCPKCRTTKPHDAFGAAIDRTDGLSGWCRACRAGGEKGRRALDAIGYRAKTRERYHAAPAKWKAKVAVERALKAGRITKPDVCPVCTKARKIEAHHHLGYERKNWLEVVWRCRPCHKLAHTRGTKQRQHAA